MKLFHISDLHLGKKLNEFSMIEDQDYILREILGIIEEEKPDGVMIAGDVYDKTVPSEEAMKLWDDFLISLAAMKVPVFAISGNHDSAIRFSNHGKLVDSTGIHLSPVYNGDAKCFTLKDGEISVNIHMLPFVKPVTVRAIFGEEEIVHHCGIDRMSIVAPPSFAKHQQVREVVCLQQRESKGMGICFLPCDISNRSLTIVLYCTMWYCGRKNHSYRKNHKQKKITTQQLHRPFVLAVGSLRYLTMTMRVTIALPPSGVLATT